MTNTFKENTNTLKYDPNKTIEIYKNDLEREKRSMKQVGDSSINCGILVTPKQTEINRSIAKKVTEKIFNDEDFKSLLEEESFKNINKSEEILGSITLKAIEKALESSNEDPQIMTLYTDVSSLNVEFSRKPSNVIASFSGKDFLTSFIFNFISAFEKLIAKNEITKKELVLSVIHVAIAIITLFIENLDKEMSRTEKDILKVFLQKDDPFAYIPQDEIFENVDENTNDVIHALDELTHYKVLEKDETSGSYQLIESLYITMK